jgi:ABC-type transport system involved in multi-copper enzyme maturation permease subunit
MTLKDFGAAVRAEALRLRAWPSFWIILGAWLALNLAFTYLFNYIAYRTGSAGRLSNGVPRQVLLHQMLPAAVPEAFTQGMAMFGGALVLVLGALATGSGYGWGTWKTALTQGPSRTAVIAATLVSLIVVAVGVVLVAFVVDTGVASLIAESTAQPLRLASAGRTLAGIGTGTGILVMWMLAGALIGTVARGPALAVGLGLVWVLVVENLLRGVGSLLGPVKAVTDYLPGTAAGSAAGAMRTVSGDPVPGVLHVLSPAASAATLVVYIAVFAGLTGWLVRRRDLA